MADDWEDANRPSIAPKGCPDAILSALCPQGVREQAGEVPCHRGGLTWVGFEPSEDGFEGLRDSPEFARPRMDLIGRVLCIGVSRLAELRWRLETLTSGVSCA